MTVPLGRGESAEARKRRWIGAPGWRPVTNQVHVWVATLNVPPSSTSRKPRFGSRVSLSTMLPAMASPVLVNVTV
jgi:hypothetical protein